MSSRAAYLCYKNKCLANLLQLLKFGTFNYLGKTVKKNRQSRVLLRVEAVQHQTIRQ